MGQSSCSTVSGPAGEKSFQVKALVVARLCKTCFRSVSGNWAAALSCIPTDLPPVIRPPVQVGFVSLELVADNPAHYVVGRYCTVCAIVQ